MNKFAQLLTTATLLLATSSAWAEADRSADLRYCLELKSNDEIAKCAGEIAPGNKGKPYSREHVERIISSETTLEPAGAGEPSGTQATGDKSGKSLLPENTESSGN